MKPATAATLRLLRIRGADGLTVAEARTTIACDRLAARVWELRQAGHVIESVSERTPMGAHVARYYLRERPTTGSQLSLTPSDGRPSGPPTSSAARRWAPEASLSGSRTG